MYSYYILLVCKQRNIFERYYRFLKLSKKKFLMLNRASFFILFLALFYCPSASSQYASAEYDSLLSLGNKVYRTADYKASAKIYLEALDKFSSNKNNRDWIIAAVGYGASLMDQGELLQGFEWVNKADSAVTNKISLELQAYVKSNMGWVTRRVKSNHEALIQYQKAFEFAKASGDEYRIAQVSNSMSTLTFAMGLYSSSVEYATAAVEAFTKIGDNFQLAMSLNNQYVAYNYLGFVDKSEKILFKSLALKIKIDNKDLISGDYASLGEFYRRKGDYDKALTYFSMYLELIKDTGNIVKIISGNDKIGSVYFALGEYEKALSYYNYSQQLRKEYAFHNPIALVSIAQTYQKLDKFELARTFFNDALVLFEGYKEPLRIIDVYLKRADLELEAQNYDAALSFSKKAVELSTETESKQLQAQSLSALAKVYSTLKQYDLALSFSKKSYSKASLFNGYKLNEYLTDLSRAFYLTGSDSAFYYAEKAFDEIERIRNNIYGDNLQTSLFRDFARFYNEVGYWYLSKKDDPEKAFSLIEKGKSRVLLDNLTLTNTQIAAIVDEPTLLAIKQKERAIDQLYRELETLQDSSLITSLKQQINTVEFDYQSTINKVRLAHKELKELEIPSVISLNELTELCDERTAIIEYAFSGETLIAFWITSQGYSYRLIEFDSTDATSIVNKQVEQFKTAIEQVEDKKVLAELSQPIYEYLLAPFLEEYTHINQILVVPDQGIALLPFDALIRDNKYLIEDINFKYLPSATVYNYIQNPHRETSQELLALAASGFEPTSNFSTVYKRNSLSSLPASLLEVDSISVHFDSKTLLNEGIIYEEDFKRLGLSSFKYIHFASHALVNEDNPQQSGLLLAGSNTTENSLGEDGYLNSMEISSLILNADMVVLSACNTGFGKVIAGEGLLGLQRSFLKAGASSVLVSLWSIYDRSTAQLMGNFYENLNLYESKEYNWWDKTLYYFDFYQAPLFDYKAKAIRDAKLSMLQHPFYNHPVYWAPFILIGK